MKTNRKTFTNVEKAVLLKSYQDSGKAKKAWCQETGVELSTLQRWLRQDKSPVNPQPMQNWISVISTAPAPSKDLEIHVGKCTIPINQQTDLENAGTGIMFSKVRNVCQGTGLLALNDGVVVSNPGL